MDPEKVTPTMEELQAQLEVLKQQNEQAAAQKKIDDEKIKNLSTDLDNAASAKTDGDKKIAELQQQNSELQAKSDKYAPPDPIMIEVDGDKYQFAYPSFHFEDQAYKSKEFAAAATAAGEKASKQGAKSLDEKEIGLLTVLSHLIKKAPGILAEVK